MCPIHGKVSNDEIVAGYEYTKGKYVLIDPEELKKLRPGADKAINIDVFIEPSALDPMHYTEQSYYLAPDGTAGQKPYAVLQQVMADHGMPAHHNAAVYFEAYLRVAGMAADKKSALFRPRVGKSRRMATYPMHRVDV